MSAVDLGVLWNLVLVYGVTVNGMPLSVIRAHLLCILSMFTPKKLLSSSVGLNGIAHCIFKYFYI